MEKSTARGKHFTVLKSMLKKGTFVHDGTNVENFMQKQPTAEESIEEQDVVWKKHVKDRFKKNEKAVPYK